MLSCLAADPIPVSPSDPCPFGAADPGSVAIPARPGGDFFGVPGGCGGVEIFLRAGARGFRWTRHP